MKAQQIPVLEKQKFQNKDFMRSERHETRTQTPRWHKGHIIILHKEKAFHSLLIKFEIFTPNLRHSHIPFPVPHTLAACLIVCGLAWCRHKPPIPIFLAGAEEEEAASRK